jgi:hypothetical protein
VSPEVKAIIAQAWDPATPHAFKDTPHAGLPDNATPRKVFIDFCNATRQRLGPDCFVVHTIQHIRQLEQEVKLRIEANATLKDAKAEPVIIITDLGFQNELDALAREFVDELFVVHVEREGHTFANDIRTHLPFKWSFTIANNGRPEDMFTAFQNSYATFVRRAALLAKRSDSKRVCVWVLDDEGKWVPYSVPLWLTDVTVWPAYQRSSIDVGVRMWSLNDIGKWAQK